MNNLTKTLTDYGRTHTTGSINTDNLPPYMRKEVKTIMEKYMPLLEELYDPNPIEFTVENLDGALGVTEFGPSVRPRYVKIDPNTPMEDLERVILHEMGHTLQASLINYADVDEPYVRAIIEGLDEYAIYKMHLELGEEDRAREVIMKSPYRNELFMFDYIDRVYQSEGGLPGYKGFIRDIINHESMAYAVDHLRECARLYESVNNF